MTAARRYEDDLALIRRLVRERSAIVLDEDKDYLIEARLGPVAERLGLSGLPELAAILRRGAPPSTVKMVVEAMTTNETSFFRDVAPFGCLESLVLPDLLPRRSSRRRLSVWCGAASAGQEPYSILFIIRRAFPELADWQVKLLATDLSADMVERTKAGTYSQVEVNRGLPAKMLVQHFERRGMRWQVKEDIRRSLEAREMNLVEPWPPLEPMDVIFLRNVLIYFDVPTKRTVLGRVKRVLAPDGYLFLGGAETTLGVDDDFERVEYPNASCYRLKDPSR